MKAQRTLQFAHARPDEILAAREQCGVLWLPVGPLEWHGPHLPFGVDPLNAEAAALACAEEVGGLVLPTLFCGTERERPRKMLADLGLNPNDHIVGMDFPSHSLPSGYSPEEEFALQVRGWIDRAVAWQFPILVIVNGHGALNHNATLDRFVQAYRSQSTPIDVLAFLALVAGSEGSLNIGHASADETSLMMLDYPTDVALELLPPNEESLKSAQFGIVDDLTFRGEPTPDYTLRREDDPRFESTPERGQQVRRRTVEYICARSGVSRGRFISAQQFDPHHSLIVMLLNKMLRLPAAVIFDMDGLLLDSEVIYGRVWEQAATELGYCSDANDYLQYVGRRAEDCTEELLATHGHNFPLSRFWQRQEELYDEHRDNHGIPIKCGADELLADLRSRNIRTAIATSTQREKALLCLGGFADNFDVIVTGDEVRRGKPDPEIFLLAARRLSTPPQDCLVLEDAEAGVRAASAACMPVIMIPDLKPCSEETALYTTRICSSLLEVRELLCNVERLSVAAIEDRH